MKVFVEVYSLDLQASLALVSELNEKGAWDINLWIDKSQTKKLKYITVRFYIDSDSKFFEKHLDEDVFKDDASKLNHKIKRKNNNESNS